MMSRSKWLPLKSITVGSLPSEAPGNRTRDRVGQNLATEPIRELRLRTVVAIECEARRSHDEIGRGRSFEKIVADPRLYRWKRWTRELYACAEPLGLVLRHRYGANCHSVAERRHARQSLAPAAGAIL